MLKKITNKQRRVLETVESFLNKNEYAPSIREIADSLDIISASTIKGHLDKLK